MANIQHSTLTDPNLHEPKGISTAAANTVYMANGSGSGTYTNVNRLPGTGWGQYSNSLYTGTAYLSITDAGVLVPFDTASTVTQLPITLAGSTSPLMDLSTETLLFVSDGDMHSITLTFFIAATSGNPTFMDLILYGSSDGTTYATLLAETSIGLFKTAAQYINATSLVPVSANMATYGARISLKMQASTGDTASIKDISLITTRVHKAR
jgi:hypothetical protein